MNKTPQNNSEISILVVDDVEVNLIILEEIIKNMGYQALLAQSVKEALQIIEDSTTLPKVICQIFLCQKLMDLHFVPC